MMKRLFKFFLLNIFFLLLTVYCMAGAPVVKIKSIPGPFTAQSNSVSGSSISVEEDNFNTAFDWSTVVDSKIVNTVSLTVDESSLINNNFNYDVTLQIDYYNSHADNGSPDGSVTKHLILNYNLPIPNQNIKTQLIDTYTFTSAYKVKVTVVGVKSSGNPINFGQNIKLNCSITIGRQYKFQPHALIAPSFTYTPDASNSDQINSPQVIVKWSPVLGGGAEQYDLEWTTINDGNDNYQLVKKYLDQKTPDPSLLPPNIFSQIFRNNATRITTDIEYYTIPLNYNDDYLLIRIRQTQYLNGVKINGDWDYTQSAPLSNQFAIFKINWNESNLNWQYSAAFAEDGKSKTIISYFDGTLRNRQTVTINNSDNIAMAQENVYDQFGRAVASILPAPFKESSGTIPYLHYISNFNINKSNVPYNSSDLNLEGLCYNAPEKLNSFSGASAYYSKSNSALPTFNPYIPDGEYYPLSVTKYTSDNTGRIKAQGGVGAAFQLGSLSTGSQTSKFTRYYYGVPLQGELDKLFGNDVGYAEHYLKNMVVDPNGQSSINYVNSSGKTIAAALTGDLPPNLNALASYPGNNSKSQIIPILNPSQFVFNASEQKISANCTYLCNTIQNQSTLSFSLPKLIDQYPNNQICSNCYYDLHIIVTNDCGDIKGETQGTVLGSNLIPVGSTNGNCNDNNTSLTTIDVHFDDIGEYHIQVDLAFNADVINKYVNQFVTDGLKNGFINQSYDYIQKNFLDQIDASGCYSDCHTCEMLLGGQAQFEQALTDKFAAMDFDYLYIKSQTFKSWEDNLYFTLKKKCDDSQFSCQYSSCSEVEEPMLQDLYPGGQYALFDNSANAIEPEVNVLTHPIFLTTNVVPNAAIGVYSSFGYNGYAPRWRVVFPILNSTDAAYQADLITLDNGVVTSPYDGNFTQAMLVKYWKPQWANLFLQYHPEYCKYLFCGEMLPYTNWDQIVQKIVVTANDVSSKIPDRLNLNAANVKYDPANNSDWILASDPFFNSPDGQPYYSQMQADLLNYSTNILHLSGAPQGLMAFIDNTLYCTNTNGTDPVNWRACAPATNCRVSDREWQTYKEYYFHLKQKYYDAVKNSRCPSNSSNCSIGTPLTVPLPGTCPTITDFTLRYLEAPDAVGNNAVVFYNPGTLKNGIKLTLYYPSLVGTSVLTNILYLNSGDSQQNLMLPIGINAKDVHIKTVDCISDVPTASVFDSTPESALNDGIVYNCGLYYAYNSQRNDLITLSDKDGKPFVTNNDIVVYLNYNIQTLVGNINTPTTLSVPITIKAGTSSTSYDYYSVKNSQDRQNNCTVVLADFKCVNIGSAQLKIAEGTKFCNVLPGSITNSNTVCDILATKIPRFPDSPSFDGSLWNGQTIATLTQFTLDAAKNQVSDFCTQNATNWVNSLMPGINKSSLNGQISAVTAAFAEVCATGGDINHPRGVSKLTQSSSTGSPTITPDQKYTSFGDVITQLLLPSNSKFTPLLNPWLISGPYPYDSQQQSTKSITSSSANICTKIAYYSQKAIAAQLPLYDYLVATFKGAMTLSASDLSMLQTSCNGTNCGFLLQHDVNLPVFLDPGSKGVVSASEYITAKNDLISQFNTPLTNTDDNYATILTNYMNYKWGFSLGYNSYSKYEILIGNDPSNSNLLVDVTPQISVTPDPYSCVKSLVEVALVNGYQAYDSYLEDQKNQFRASYINTCSLAKGNATISTTERVYHYTLYYYDQADNLIRTVPPEGVTPITDPNLLQQIQVARASGGTTKPFVFPNHTMLTNYAYNSTNQVVQQYSPDGDVNNYWYDILSRLTISQNKKQFDNSNYSYTLYDPLGRISEVGENNVSSSTTKTTLPTVTTTDISSNNSIILPDYLASLSDASTYLDPLTNNQITHTYYDSPAPALNGIRIAQGNLRKRVSASTYQDAASSAVTQATYYDYDLDGNVKTLYQQIDKLGLKQVGYEYDLVSGKVNFVKYQDGQPDQFYYKYQYDAENRLTDAYSGTAAIIDADNGSDLLTYNAKLDAHYAYYLHGPLARMELGDLTGKVQGMDYAYTLQGWLKGVNSTSLAPGTEMGNDGQAGTAHSTIGRDVYGYALHYYGNDYQPIGGINPFADGSASAATTGFNPLYNGNISAVSVNLTLPLASMAQPLLYVYGYDQLNRLTKQNAFKGLQAGNTWQPVSLADYQETVSYDANGNIKSYTRNGNATTGNPAAAMDQLSYTYNKDAQGNKTNNQLRFVNDAVTASNYSGSDLQSQNGLESQAQSLDNYQYDQIGNLIADNQANITGIDWSVYGKIRSITKNTGNNIGYTYDAAGHRVSKTVVTPGTTPTTLTTFYVRDAQGNPLAVYDDQNSTINWREQHLYGSSRLGMWQPNAYINAATAANTEPATLMAWNMAGNKYYELINHLGNVMATITDRRLQVPDVTNTAVDHYEADIATAQDYYPFGMLMPGRQYTASGNNYRYGFNGKENDNEVKGEGNQQDYGMRIYDPRVGRFLSVDPIGQHFPWNTPYSFAENKVIEGVDFDGLEVMIVTQKSDPTIYNVGIQNTSKDEINVYAHGSQYGMGNNDGLWFHNEGEFDKYMTKVSDQWRNRQSDGGTVLVLHSCRTGRPIEDKNGMVVGPPIAQKISKQFNVTVIAPDERDNFSKDGEKGPLVDEDPNQDKNGTHPDHKHHEATDIKGNWNVFKDGVLIESYRGGWTPKAKATWWDKLIYGRDIKKVPQAEIKVPDSQPAPANSSEDKDKKTD